MNFQINLLGIDLCFVHHIFSTFGFWYFGHFSFLILFPFFRLTHFALQNVNKDYIFITSSPKVTKNQKGDEQKQSLDKRNDFVQNFVVLGMFAHFALVI